MSHEKQGEGLFHKYQCALEGFQPIRKIGRVVGITGSLIESEGPQARIGELCLIQSSNGKEISAEVVGFHNRCIRLMAYDPIEGLEVGCSVVGQGSTLVVPVSDSLLGRVLNSKGEPIDGKGALEFSKKYSIFAAAPDVLKRKPITERLFTGIKAVDFMTPVAKGQRMGIFSGSGVGKSTLIGMIARNTSADVNVIALIGERGREVQETLFRDLGEEGLKRSVIIVSNSDTPALSRVRGAFAALAVAEYFRDQGKDVMLLFDSVTRLAMAQREIGQSIGEPSATKGYTPSCAVVLQQILERCGTNEYGSISGFFTVLIEGDDMDDYVADTVRGILDGHIVLDRLLATKNHYPPIDVLNSLSRLANRIVSPNERKAAGKLRELLSTYKQHEDLILVGAVQTGNDLILDEAINKNRAINEFLKQEEMEKESYWQTLKKVSLLTDFDFGELKALYGKDETEEPVPLSYVEEDAHSLHLRKEKNPSAPSAFDLSGKNVNGGFLSETPAFNSGNFSTGAASLLARGGR